MNILVIGANGLLGRELVSLLKIKHYIYALDLNINYINK